MKKQTDVIKAFGTRGGIRAPHRKNTAEEESLLLPTPQSVAIPLQMHIGAPCTAIVNPGDSVLVGQKIADSDAFVSAPIHASVSGTVKEIRKITVAGGGLCDAIAIESDGAMAPVETVPPDVHDAASLANAARECGLVGLGGAGFPTHIKLRIPEGKRINTLIVNVAECEPYLTADYREVIENSWDIMSGIYAIKKYLGIHRVLIAVESNKPEAIEILSKIAKNEEADPNNEVSVLRLKARYPQGAEKVLIRACTGRRVPPGKLPADVGCIVLNVTSVATLARYLKTGMPLTKKRITVDGGGIASPKNVIVPIGTSVGDVLRFVGVAEDTAKVLYGGPMMGLTVASEDMVITKNNNGLLAFGENEARLPEPGACIRCGNCLDVCPMALAPALMEKAVLRKDLAQLEKLDLLNCMECGCCSYGCPAHRPLVQTFRLGKSLLKEKKK